MRRAQWMLVVLALLHGLAQSQPTRLVRATELRQDKLPAAAVIRPLPAGASLDLIQLEGGWAWVSVPSESGRLQGWVRAGTLDIASASAEVARLNSGREAGGNKALTLGVRSLPRPESHHALVIGVSRYSDPQIPPLPGARVDRESATQMARAMQVPADRIRYLQDEQATGDAIRGALRDLAHRVEDGDRVFIHFSGHGTRYRDPSAGACVEALLAHEGGASGTLTNAEIARLLEPITRKTDKLMVIYDACHSGGVIEPARASSSRSFSTPADEGLLRPRSGPVSDECAQPVNYRTRSFLAESQAQGSLPQDVIHVSSAQDNEVSFDDEVKGGLATQFLRDCMLRDARDLDGSGAITMEEIRQCAQTKIEQRLRGNPDLKPHHIVLSGNRDFVPTGFKPLSSAPSAAPGVVASTAPAAAPRPAEGAAPEPSGQTSTPAAAAPALRQIFQQRDGKREVRVSLDRKALRIGRDRLGFSVQSSHAGYVYVALAGSDRKSLYLLFPNEADGDNRIEPGRTLELPRPRWNITASGPPGRNDMLVVVTDRPRDLSVLAGRKAGPFLMSLDDAHGRSRLGALLSMPGESLRPDCGPGAPARCSDAFGAALLTIDEVP